jgi:Uma2 family endonuclease
LATKTSITFAQYQATTFEPDQEWVDGELKERNLGSFEHSFVQAWLALWFGNHKREWNVTVVTEQRTEVGPGKVRIPDVMLVRRGPHPSTIVAPPILAVEILSSDDSYRDLEVRVSDFLRMGASAVWLIDPDTRSGRLCLGNSWTLTEKLTVPGTPIFLELSDLWSELDAEIQNGASLGPQHNE